MTLKDRRTAAELALVQGALARDMPVLGICGGQQLLAVALGGTLIQHIPDSVPGALEHEQPNPRDEPGHAVAITPGTLLHRIVGTQTMQVNSAHHQAVATPGGRMRWSTPSAPDGVVEGVEDGGYRFCLGTAMASGVPDRPGRRPDLRRLRRRRVPVSEAGTRERGERIAKWLARAGVASRRDAEKLLAEGRVKAERRPRDPSRHLRLVPGDIVQVNNRVVDAPDKARLWRYHKPEGLVTTHRDPEGRPTVFERLPEHLPRVVSIGRLDLNSEGLLLLTNDGGLARRQLELPSNGWARRYRVRVHGVVPERALAGLADGADGGGRALRRHRGRRGFPRAEQHLAEREPARRPQPGNPPGDDPSRAAGDAADPGGIRPVPARQPRARRGG